jgi:mannose-6-phosphate isomerase-like protein (cupin superfamily)
MQRKRTEECTEITANDGCRLRELLHPDRDPGDLPYSLAVARLEPGGRTLPHRLTEETEVYYILAGTGRIQVGEELEPVEAGDVVVVPSGVEQSIQNVGTGELRFLVTVSPPWIPDHDIRS